MSDLGKPLKPIELSADGSAQVSVPQGIESFVQDFNSAREKIRSGGGASNQTGGEDCGCLPSIEMYASTAARNIAGVLADGSLGQIDGQEEDSVFVEESRKALAEHKDLENGIDWLEDLVGNRMEDAGSGIRLDYAYDQATDNMLVTQRTLKEFDYDRGGFIEGSEKYYMFKLHPQTAQ